MRCVSKCFIGSRNFRMYSLLLIGVMVGLSLSLMLQSFAKLHKGDTLVDARKNAKSRDSDRIGFSNLPHRDLGEDQEINQQINFGDYNYERELEGRQQQRYNNPVSELQPPPSKAPSPATLGSPSLTVPEAVQLRKREYQSKNWQGRNVRESNEDGLPPNKLSDELATRQTLLVAVITSAAQLISQTLAIQGTWGPEATQVIFFVGEGSTLPHLPHGMNVIQLEGVDDEIGGWEMKEIAAMKYLMDHYVDKVDWFMIIGDRTYVVTEELEKKLENVDPRVSVYMGLAGEISENGKSLLCRKDPGIIYSRTLLEGLRPYLPMCWPRQGETSSLGGCISTMGVKCTQAKETQELFLPEAKLLIESSSLFQQRDLAKAVAISPVQSPKYMYRLHSFYKELQYNRTMEKAKLVANKMLASQPFIPSHLRSTFQLHASTATSPQSPSHASQQQQKLDGGVVIRPRHIPRNKFEVNYWEYFNQTRLMSIMHESPARGIIGGIREEARFALTKAIYQANHGIPQAQRYIFDKLENGYHRVDPMRGSEFILDFIFRKQSDKSVKIKKRLSILRPFHETVVPIEAPEMLPTVNFLVTLSGLSNRLEHFLMQYERNVLQLGEDATLTIVLFESPDAAKVRFMVQQYLTRYQGAKMTVLDIRGDFARGVGLHHGMEKFQEDQLMFIVDVDLDISTDFLQRCRLNTIKGKQIYFPVFFKLYNKEFVDRYHHKRNHTLLISRHRGHWAHYSYGMVCIYASDYRKSGGFDVSMRGWGEEDVDLLNRVLKSGLEVFRAPDPGLIHNWHSKSCNKDKISNPAVYEHCLQSKGENLADRIELAQYVFENELKKGNTL